MTGGARRASRDPVVSQWSEGSNERDILPLRSEYRPDMNKEENKNKWIKPTKWEQKTTVPTAPKVESRDDFCGSSIIQRTAPTVQRRLGGARLWSEWGFGFHPRPSRRTPNEQNKPCLNSSNLSYRQNPKLQVEWPTCHQQHATDNDRVQSF